MTEKPTVPAVQPPAPPEAPAATGAAAAEAPVTAVATEAAAGAVAVAEAPEAAPAKHDDEPPQIDEETYKAQLAAGKSEREARALAKKAWVLKRRKA